jgi:pyrroloquinoline quinone biosynthesis protein B
LRQAGNHALRIFSSATVRRLAAADVAFAAFTRAPHRWDAVAAGETVLLDDRLRARAVAMDGLTPGYAGREPLPDAVTAYLLLDSATGGSALFAPVFAAVNEALLDESRHADVAFFDGSFYSDDELGDVGVEKPARSLGHAPIAGHDGSLAVLVAGVAKPGSQRFFAHLNNTNPILDRGSPAFAAVATAGFQVAEDAMEFEL